MCTGARCFRGCMCFVGLNKHCCRLIEEGEDDSEADFSTESFVALMRNQHKSRWPPILELINLRTIMYQLQSGAILENYRLLIFLEARKSNQLLACRVHNTQSWKKYSHQVSDAACHTGCLPYHWPVNGSRCNPASTTVWEKMIHLICKGDRCKGVRVT